MVPLAWYPVKKYMCVYSGYNLHSYKSVQTLRRNTSSLKKAFNIKQGTPNHFRMLKNHRRIVSIHTSDKPH